MPTYDEQKQIDKSAREAQRRAAEDARKKKYNPDGTLRKPPAKTLDKPKKTSRKIPVFPWKGREMNKVVDEE
tara:strand:- start:124 stop:339 length:216 start_codon:yes stop_codon:yes gene_type:complete